MTPEYLVVDTYINLVTKCETFSEFATIKQNVIDNGLVLDFTAIDIDDNVTLCFEYFKKPYQKFDDYRSICFSTTYRTNATMFSDNRTAR